MAHTLTYDLGEGFGPFARLRRALSDYRLYRKTFGELDALSDRELADLGISRLSVREIARESVYGA
jgi:uncharacterized protein YjiS (DUF1127 family)